jgi:hypothetical protein
MQSASPIRSSASDLVSSALDSLNQDRSPPRAALRSGSAAGEGALIELA